MSALFWRRRSANNLLLFDAVEWRGVLWFWPLFCMFLFSWGSSCGTFVHLCIVSLWRAPSFLWSQQISEESLSNWAWSVIAISNFLAAQLGPQSCSKCEIEKKVNKNLTDLRLEKSFCLLNQQKISIQFCAKFCLKSNSAPLLCLIC